MSSPPPPAFLSQRSALEQPKSGFTPEARKLFPQQGTPRPFCQEITSEEILARPTTYTHTLSLELKIYDSEQVSDKK